MRAFSRAGRVEASLEIALHKTELRMSVFRLRCACPELVDGRGMNDADIAMDGPDRPAVADGLLLHRLEPQARRYRPPGGKPP
ncbi:MAG TPA: hypothetical protein VNE18_12390 [Rhodanobacter sp.]|nr:hypothetical protein [Rhodanobacter sp.]